MKCECTKHIFYILLIFFLLILDTQCIYLNGLTEFFYGATYTVEKITQERMNYTVLTEISFNCIFCSNVNNFVRIDSFCVIAAQTFEVQTQKLSIEHTMCSLTIIFNQMKLTICQNKKDF